MKSKSETIKKSRRENGEGGLRPLSTGNWEGVERIPKKSGGILIKSVTRKDKKEVLTIKSQLRALAPLDDDVCKIEINKFTNEITLIRTKQLRGKQHIDKNITVNEYVDYWLWNHRRKGMKGKQIVGKTLEDYVQKAMHIKKRLGTVTNEQNELVDVKVSELTFERIETALLELFDDVCEYTAVQVKNHIYNMMRCAYKKDKIISENPLEDEEINFPKSKEKKEKKVIKQKYEKEVIEYCLKHWYLDVLMQFFTGARVSEIRGLTWDNVNIEEETVKFNKEYNSVKEFIYENNEIISLGRKNQYIELKTPSSYRTIKLPTEFIKVLKIHKFLQQKLAEKLHIKFSEKDPIFTTATYTQIGRNDTNDRVKKMVKDLQIEDWEEITSHCLRHGFCYAGLLNDVPLEYMQLLLGHEDISVTREWYAHFDDKKVKSSAVKVNSTRQEYLSQIISQRGICATV